MGFPTRLHVRVPRFTCTNPTCSRKTFQASLPCADDGAKMTHRVTRWILQRLAVDRMSVTATAKALGGGLAAGQQRRRRRGPQPGLG